MRVAMPAYVMRMNVEAAKFAGVPEKLDKLADVVLAYKPKEKQKRRKRKKAKRATGN